MEVIINGRTVPRTSAQDRAITALTFFAGSGYWVTAVPDSDAIEVGQGHRSVIVTADGTPMTFHDYQIYGK